MKVTEYLRRVDFQGAVRPGFATLEALHRAHANRVPFENLDVQLRRPLDTDVEAAFEKIVRRRRGGWCYEMNGLMGWVLEQIGYDVTRLCGGVMREEAGDGPLGNHLCLLVQLEKPYLVDVGFGGSLAAPIALERTERVDAPYRLSLAEADSGYWRFSEQAHGAPFSFDFRPNRADEGLLASKCQALQTEPSSPFLQNLVVQRRDGDSHLTLRGRVFSTMTSAGIDKVVLDSPDELVGVLRDAFDLEVPEAASLWPAICARHETLFGRSD